MIRKPLLPVLGAFLLSILSSWGDESSRYFQPTPGFTRVRDLPDAFRGKVGVILFTIKDAFEGTVAHSEAEKKIYDIGNELHINTRESTVRHRLLFREGDTVTADLLRENEKNLRGEQFLADAFIEVKRQADSTLVVKITTYDQWTTVPGFGLVRKGGEWVWWIGPVESNLLGTGQQVSFFVGHDLQDDSRSLNYQNTAFTSLKLQLSGQYAWLQDHSLSGSEGYSYSFALNRPLLARTDQWGFSLSASGGVSAEDIYLSGNDLDKLSREGRLDSSGRVLLGQTNLQGQFKQVATHDAYVGITRSFGYFLKTSVTPFYERYVRYDVDGYGIPLSLLPVLDSLGVSDSTAPKLDTRRDELMGMTVSLYQYADKTVHNFRNLKWSEPLETGWRLTVSLAQDQTWLGARNSDLMLSYAAVYNDEWKDRFFFNSNASVRYFLNPDSGGFDNGSLSAYAEAQWKPVYYLSTVLTGQYNDLFTVTPSQLLYLGGESGLNGFPNYYYAGKACVLFTAEQRLFPPFEFGTLVPAFAVFANAGNTYSSYDAVDLNDMHYAVGIGLRLGSSRSVQKVVNHIDLAWPVGEKNLGPWSPLKYLSISASKSL